MIGSRRAAITASLIGALLIAGAPTFAFGDQGSTHESKANSVAVQKAKDAEDKKAADKKAGDNKAGDNKAADKKAGDNKASDKKSGDDKKGAADKKPADKKPADKKPADKKADENKNKADENAAADKKKSDDKKSGRDDKQASDKKPADKRSDEDRKAKTDPGHKDDWKNKQHDDKWDREWDHNRDADHRHHSWDTHRRYYRYGYYGPGYYDDCGYYSPGYDGYNDNYSYYGPDACGYEYGGYQSHFLVDMSWDQEVPRPGPKGAVGTANIDIDVPAGQLCFRLAYDGIDRAVGAQIHPGRLGEGGPNLVLLHVGDNGDDGCVGVDPRILSEIQNDPRGYYLEVDDQNGPAMRGQLDAPDYRNRY
jgi:hypothetical protein